MSTANRREILPGDPGGGHIGHGGVMLVAWSHACTPLREACLAAGAAHIADTGAQRTGPYHPPHQGGMRIWYIPHQGGMRIWYIPHQGG